MVEWLSLIHYNNRPDTVYQICQQPGVSCYQFIIVVRVSPISLGSHDRANILRYRFHNTWPIKKAKWYNSTDRVQEDRRIATLSMVHKVINGLLYINTEKACSIRLARNTDEKTLHLSSCKSHLRKESSYLRTIINWSAPINRMHLFRESSLHFLNVHINYISIQPLDDVLTPL
jgi:hypothetical protein